MARCSFCGVIIRSGTGKIFAKTDGKLLHFCTRRCEKSLLQLKRKPLRTRWTRFFKK